MNTPQSPSGELSTPREPIDLTPKRQRYMTRLAVLLAAIGVACGGAWLYAQQRPALGQFGPTGAQPAYIVVNTPTPVLFTSEITDRRLKKRSVVLVRLDATGKPSEILGRLRDDGRNGDVRANDSIYTLTLMLSEPAVGSVSFSVAARFKAGVWREPEPDDDDWDRELSFFNQTRRDHPSRRQMLARLLARLGRYQLSSPVQVTVDPFSLPPDPGEVGKQTLEGIDSDGDGVRDDVQRLIALKHFNSERAMRSLNQYADVIQTFLSSATDPVALKAADAERRLANDCLEYVFGPLRGSSGAAEVKFDLLNTAERVRAFAAAENAAGPSSYFLTDESQLKVGCTVDPDTLPN